MRGAHRQGRACYLYAFSGPGDVEGMELDTKPDALAKLLTFLSHSFGGGTDVDAPLDLSLRRVAQAEWSQADILLVSTRSRFVPAHSHISAAAGCMWAIWWVCGFLRG